MGKHKNAAQSATILQFMERHPDIAQGHTKGDRVRVEQQWQELCNALNSQGPSKDVRGWKKTFIDWKCEVRKKLAHNRRESSATGGGAFNKYNLTEAEETLARVTGMYTAVEGIPNSTSFGLDETVDLQVEVMDLTQEDLMPSTSTAFKRPNSFPIQASTPKKKKEMSLQDCLKESIEIQKNFNDKVDGIMDALLETRQSNNAVRERFCNAMEKISETLVEMKDNIKRQGP